MLPFLPLLGVPVIQAQTTSITSSGLNTQVTLGSVDPGGRQNYDITGGTRPGNGGNLFHSFGDFSVGTNNVARFGNDSGLATTNILSRVTGGNPSNIFGEISTASFPGANLYLINPAGVVFGPTASLNVSGSVNVSTADYLRLSDGLRFNAIPGPQDALLSAAPVVAFGFLHSAPKPIVVEEATLEVRPLTPSSPGKTLALVGGDITLSQGTLSAGNGGQIRLVSVASPGEVSPGAEFSLGTRGGVVTLTDSLLQVNRGEIEIRGGQLVMEQSMLTTLTEIDPIRGGGAITMHAKETIRADQSQIAAPGGTISLEAGEAIRLTDSNVESSFTGPADRGGPVNLTANLIRLNNSVVGAASVDDPGGAVTIQADQLRLENGSRIDVRSGPLPGAGLGGSVTIHANRMIGQDATILAGGALGGGKVVIDATETVRLDGSRIDTVPTDLGSAGNISIQAGDSVRLLNGTVLSADNHRGLPGDAGNIVIEAGKTVVSEGSTVSAQSTKASEFPRSNQAGNITIQAGERIRLDGSLVSTSAQDIAEGGNVSLRSDVIRLRDGTRVESTGVNGPGGTITIQANDYRNVNSTVDAGSQFGPNGTVSIQPLP
jgi:filamentous hemagglutinin family protein